ncbi:MAG: hypothetical protein AAF628_29440 [Planctomycetota bacterium]
MLLAYVGPDAVMPVASAFAAILGFLLLCWRWVITRVKRVFRFIFRIKAPETTEETLPAEDKAVLND